MRLTTTAAVRNAIGFEDMPDINTAIESALDTTSIWLEQKLGSMLDETTLTSRYFLEVHERASDNVPPNTRLKLKSGLVQSGSITVKAYSEWSDPGTAVTITKMLPETPRGLERGILLDTETWYGASSNWTRFVGEYAGPFIEVSYTVGFPVDGTDSDLYEQTVVPTWLKEAAKLNALIMLENHPVVKNADLEQDTDMLRDRLSTLLKQYSSYAPSAKLAL